MEATITCATVGLEKKKDWELGEVEDLMGDMGCEAGNEIRAQFSKVEGLRIEQWTICTVPLINVKVIMEVFQADFINTQYHAVSENSLIFLKFRFPCTLPLHKPKIHILDRLHSFVGNPDLSK